MMFVDIPRSPAFSEGNQRNSGSGSVGMLGTREFRQGSGCSQIVLYERRIKRINQKK